MIRRCLAIALLLVFPIGASAYDALLLDPDEHRIVDEPDVAIADDGSTVVVWASRVRAGAQPLNGIRVRRFDSAGRATGEVFRIDVLPGDLARKPAVDITPDGSRIVVAWEGGTEGDRLRRRIWVQVFDAGGLPVGEEIRVDQRRMTHDQYGLPRKYYEGPEVSIAPNGEFVVVWRSEGGTSCDRFNISARRFSRDGAALGDEFIVNTDHRGSQLNPKVDHDAHGGFIVVWQSGRWIGTNEEWSQIVGRCFDPLGRARSAEFPLTGDTREAAALPSLVVAPNGAFACAWKEGSGAGSLQRIGAQTFHADGAPLGLPITIVPGAPAVGGPLVAIVRDVELMVAWNGVATERITSPAELAQSFSADGAQTSVVFPLSPETCWGVSLPSLASSRDGGAIVWKSTLESGMIVRRFSTDAPSLDVPLISGGKRFFDMVESSRRVLVDSGAEARQREGAARFLFCMRRSAGSALADLRRCSKGDQPTALQAACSFGVAAVAEGPKEALPTLIGIMTDRARTDGVRSAAACATGLLGPGASAAAAVLESELGDANGQIVGCAGLSLGKIGADGSVSALVDALLGTAPATSGMEAHRKLISGLVEFPEDPRVAWALRRYWRACIWRDEYSGAVTDGIEPYVKYVLRKRKVDDPRIIDATVVEAQRRLEEGWIDDDGYSYDLDRSARQQRDDIDIIVTRFVAIRNLGPVSLCDGTLALASALAELDPLPDWAVEMFRSLLSPHEPSPCFTDLLPLVESMGERGAPLAESIAGHLGPEDVPSSDAIRAIAATDPGCETCGLTLMRLLASEDLQIKIEAIRALIAGGPKVLWGFKSVFFEMLRDPSPELRRYADTVMDLIEIDADSCSNSWLPIALPMVEPSPIPAPAGGSVPPATGARPPRPIRTPVGRFGVAPKRPG